MTSTGDPGKRREAMGRILSALIGTVLTFGAYILSRTINPQLVTSDLGIEISGGVVLYSGGGCTAGQGYPFNQSSPDINDDIGVDGFAVASLQFLSKPGELEVVFYSQPNYGGTATRLSSDQQGCLGASGASGARSIKFVWSIPGAYLCTQPLTCSGPLTSCRCPLDATEKYLPLSTALLDETLNDNVISFRQVTATSDMSLGGTCDRPAPAGALRECQTASRGTASVVCVGNAWVCRIPLINYGVVLHRNANWSGSCKVLLATTPDITSDPIIGTSTSSITVFSHPTTAATATTPLTGGVYLCEQPDPQRPTGTAAADNPSDCHGPFQRLGIPGAPDQGLFGSDALSEIDDAHSCPSEWLDAGATISSIIIDGNYLVALFDGSDPIHSGECEVFTSSDADLLDNRMGRCCCGTPTSWGCRNCASSVIVVPTTGTVYRPGTVITPPPSPSPPPPGGSLLPCIDNSCSCQDGRRCNASTSYQTCGNNGRNCLEWGSSTSCAPGLVCAGSACEASCQAGGAPGPCATNGCNCQGGRMCDGPAGYRVCENNGSCLEWGGQTPCDPGATCSGSSCNAACLMVGP